MQYRITLVAGTEVRQEMTGRTLVVVATGVAAQVDLKVEIDGFAAEELRDVRRGLKLRTGGFTGIVLKSLVDTTVEVVAAYADISINYTDDSEVNATIVGIPTVSVVAPLSVVVPNPSGVNDNAAVAVAAVAQALAGANNTRKSIRFHNIGPDAVAIGTTGITWAKRCICLQPGDIWVEDSAASVAWQGICDAAKTASVTVQEVLV